MIAQQYEVIVVGVGGMGSAAIYHLAKRGVKVLGLERFGVAHDRGSSHGLTRIFRFAQFKDPRYVPLMYEAYDLWKTLDEEAEASLIQITGSIDAGEPDSDIVRGSRQSCDVSGLPYEVLTSTELSARFPGYQLPEETLAIFQPDGGILLPERCIREQIKLANRYGAEVHFHEPVIRWEVDGEGVKVTTESGIYYGDRLIITAGAWSSQLIPQLSESIAIERQVSAWFEPHRPELFQPELFPVLNWVHGDKPYYAIPAFGDSGFKFGLNHHLKEIVDPETVNRDCCDKDEQILRQPVEQFFPDAAGKTLDLKACLYSNSLDEHFIVDSHPQHDLIVFAAGFSGHGFKFCSRIGEILAQMVLGEPVAFDVNLFKLNRFHAHSL